MSPQIKSPATSSQPAQGSFQNTQCNSIKLSKREHRIVSALLERPHSPRELMNIAPSNNPAQYILQLRNKLSLTIPCEHIPYKTIDSESSWFGIYSLTDADRAKIESGRFSI